MNFSSMDYFIMVARERSFTRAAERLHITQQTLSAHIAGLEKELGTKLLVRSIPLELTYVGEVFLQYALDLQRRVTSLEREFQDIADNQRGLLRIGVTYTRGDVIMPSLLIRFQERYPNITIRTVGSQYTNLFSQLENGEIDLAISPFSSGTPSIEIQNFYEEELVLLVPKTILKSLGIVPGTEAFARLEQGDLSPLQKCPFLMFSDREFNGMMGNSLLRKFGVVPASRMEFLNNGVHTQLLLAAMGVGACFSAQNAMQVTLLPEQQERLQVVHLGEEAKYWVRFGYLKENYRWSVIEDFIHMAQEMRGAFQLPPYPSGEGSFR